VLARNSNTWESWSKRAVKVNRRLLMIGAWRPGLCHRLCTLRAHPPALPYARANEPELPLRDQRAMALAGALCLVVHAVTGFTNTSLRGARWPDPRQGLQLFSDELRPATPTSTRADRTTSGNQLLHRHPEGNPCRRLLHQVADSPASALLAATSPPAPAELAAPSPPLSACLATNVTNARLGAAA